MNEPYQPSRPVPPGYREVQCIYVGSKEGHSLLQNSSNQQIESSQRERTPLMTRRRRKPATRQNDESQEAFPKRHRRKCQVCQHPDRDAIEGAFIMWRRPKGIAEVYRLRGDSLYRHAVALDLFTRRRNNFRTVLENIMERGVETEITGETILGAVKAYSCLDENNHWIEPCSNVIFSTKRGGTPTISVATNSDLVPRFTNYESQITPSNRNSQELEIDVTP